MLKYIAVALLLAVSSPALAAEFYVAKDTSTQVCEITEKKPDGTKLVMVGTKAYATKDEAKAARKAAKQAGECKKVKPASEGGQ